MIDDQAQRLGLAAQAKSLDGVGLPADVGLIFAAPSARIDPEDRMVDQAFCQTSWPCQRRRPRSTLAQRGRQRPRSCRRLRQVRLAGDGLGAGQGLGVGANPVLNAATADDRLTVVMDAVCSFLLPLVRAAPVDNCVAVHGLNNTAQSNIAQNFFLGTFQPLPTNMSMIENTDELIERLPRCGCLRIAQSDPRQPVRHRAGLIPHPLHPRRRHRSAAAQAVGRRKARDGAQTDAPNCGDPGPVSCFCGLAG